MRAATYALVFAVSLFSPTESKSIDLSDFEDACKEIGFKPATPAYGHCVLELDRRARGSTDAVLPDFNAAPRIGLVNSPPKVPPVDLNNNQTPVVELTSQPTAPEITAKQQPAEASLAATALAIGASRASASAAGPLAGFYLSIKLIQITALSGVSDMWNALGYSQKAGEINMLAVDLEKGDLANQAAMDVFKASGTELQEQIEALETAGITLTEVQQAAARRAYLKIAGTTALWVGAGFSAAKLLTSDLDILSKVVLGATMAAEAKSAAESTRALLSVWASYRDFTRGSFNMKEPSKEILSASPRLASL